MVDSGNCFGSELASVFEILGVNNECQFEVRSSNRTNIGGSFL